MCGVVISVPSCLLEKASLKTKTSQACRGGWPWHNRRKELSVSLTSASVLCSVNLSCGLLALFSLCFTVLGHARVRQQVVLRSGGKCQMHAGFCPPRGGRHRPGRGAAWQLKPSAEPGASRALQGWGYTSGGVRGRRAADSAPCLFHRCL